MISLFEPAYPSESLKAIVKERVQITISFGLPGYWSTRMAEQLLNTIEVMETVPLD